uniref:Uncharacterized protein LOC114340293 n=1 Tax=Diabrotica virgifera virgifera TaxID=50390 RepID=A0A6P7GNR5_DIAVI
MSTNTRNSKPGFRNNFHNPRNPNQNFTFEELYNTEYESIDIDQNTQNTPDQEAYDDANEEHNKNFQDSLFQKSTDLIELNFSTNQRELPYIQIHEPPLKLLVDTGSSKSFLNPEKANFFYKNFICYEPFVVSAVFQSTKKDFCAEIPIFSEFHQEVKIKFHLFDFHRSFDGLLGLDNKKYPNAKLDFVNSQLTTPYSSIPITYYKSDLKIIFKQKLDPLSCSVAKIPVSQKSGCIFIPDQTIQKCVIPACLSNAIDGFALVEIFNRTQDEIFVTLDAPIDTVPFDENCHELFHADIVPADETENINIEDIYQ